MDDQIKFQMLHGAMFIYRIATPSAYTKEEIKIMIYHAKLHA